MLLRRINRFVALNGEIFDDLVSIGVREDRVQRLPNGVDTSLYRPPAEEIKAAAKARLSVPPGGILILGVGRLKPQKSWTTLLDALALAKPSAPPLRAIILGSGSQRPQLEKRIRDLGLDGDVRITSTAGDVRRYYDAADIFVLPSLWEGISNALLEAMSTGLPCICTDIPGNADVIEDGRNGRLFPREDVNALGEFLLDLIENPRERRRLGDSARETVLGRFDVNGVARAYAESFAELVPGARLTPLPDGDRSEAHNREEEPVCG